MCSPRELCKLTNVCMHQHTHFTHHRVINSNQLTMQGDARESANTHKDVEQIVQNRQRIWPFQSACHQRDNVRFVLHEAFQELEQQLVAPQREKITTSCVFWCFLVLSRNIILHTDLQPNAIEWAAIRCSAPFTINSHSLPSLDYAIMTALSVK